MFVMVSTGIERGVTERTMSNFAARAATDELSIATKGTMTEFRAALSRMSLNTESPAFCGSPRKYSWDVNVGCPAIFTLKWICRVRPVYRPGLIVRNRYSPEELVRNRPKP